MYLTKIKNNTARIFSVLTFVSIGFIAHGIGHAQAVASSFSTDSNLQNGTIVRLAPNNASKVEALSETDTASMYGVVVPPGDTPFTLSNPGSTNQVYVATTGNYNVLVSTQNGNIKVGNYITISAIDGVGMSADNKQSLVLGKALGNFDGTNALTTTTLKGSSTGQKVAIGIIPVNITIAHNPLIQNQSVNLPSFLIKATQAVTNKPVSTVRIYIGLFTVVVCTIFSGVILYGGVKSSLIAIGRNPLSRKSVIRGLFQVTLVSLIIFTIGLFAVYLLLIL